jgi:Holliday junction resolvase RusA-like endonuclease
MNCPVEITISFILKRPKQIIWKTKPMFRLWHDKTPDLDNLVKAVVDGLNGIAFHDDRQIVQLVARKSIAKDDREQPKAIILIGPAPDLCTLKEGVWE